MFVVRWHKYFFVRLINSSGLSTVRVSEERVFINKSLIKETTNDCKNNPQNVDF